MNVDQPADLQPGDTIRITRQEPARPGARSFTWEGQVTATGPTGFRLAYTTNNHPPRHEHSWFAWNPGNHMTQTVTRKD